MHDSLDVELFELLPEKKYYKLTLYSKVGYRAAKSMKDPVIPNSIDVSGYSRIVIALPVG